MEKKWAGEENEKGVDDYSSSSSSVVLMVCRVPKTSIDSTLLC